MAIPYLLKNIPSPPTTFYHIGADIEFLLQKPRLAVVGSRKVTNYGRQVTTELIQDLARKGVVIISGLAYGVDALAHKAALDVGGVTIAVLPGPLDDVAPKMHKNLAEEILAKGGALVSEYPSGYPVQKINFIARNRLVSGLADAVLITEAALKSGSLHTARFALEQGKDVLAVPGNINSQMSVGTNNLIKSGATPVTSASDVLYALGLEEQALSKQIPLSGLSERETKIIVLLQSGLTDGEEIQKKSHMDIGLFNQTLTLLEITGAIRALGANRWSLK